MKDSSKEFARRMLLFILILGILVSPTAPAKAAQIYLEPEEQEYISRGAVIRAASIDGGAPLHYRDSRGRIRGIAVRVLDEIASISGLVFECELYDSVEEAIASGAEILFGATREYAPPNVTLSTPYLESETILYYSSLLDPKQLEDKRFAAIKGGTLPEGIKEENTVYFANREEAINAVETGKADYGFGNEYSLAFYTLQNSYRNIVTVPTEKEKRAYCMGLTGDDSVLLSIINRSIEAIDRNRMETLVLEVVSQVEKKITLPLLAATYGREIFIGTALAIVVLLFSFLSTVRSKNRYKMENKRYRLLSRISNEYLFEYGVESGSLEISDKLERIIAFQESRGEIIELLKDALAAIGGNDSTDNVSTIKLPFSDDDTGVFKIVCSKIYDEKRRPYSVIGKLIDISEEEMERERLLHRSRLDGLTGLYNAAVARELISKSIKKRGKRGKDAVIIIDCDKFKRINDTLGHLKGDQVLQSISRGLRLNFRETDIIGRMGGDEFCVYMHDIPSLEFVRSKCQHLIGLIGESNRDFEIAVSMGIAILDQESSYDILFKRADEALYLAKGKGGAQIVVYGEE